MLTKAYGRGFTLSELLVVIAILAVIVGFILPVIMRAREGRSRTTCKSHLSQIGKACGMYAEVPANLGKFPDFNDDPMHSLNLLYDGYVDDPRVLSCPSNPVTIEGLNKATAPGFKPNLGGRDGKPGSSYGYDPGHLDTHGLAGIAADVGPRPDESQLLNSGNHGGESQNLLLGAGSVEWLDSPIRDLGDDGEDNIWIDDVEIDGLDTVITQGE